MEQINTLAFLAQSIDYGDSDRICTLLTQVKGKISAIAKGAKKSRKRFGGALSFFILGEAMLRMSASGRGDFWILERFTSKEDFGGSIAQDLIKLGHGSYLLELARELWPLSSPEPQGFALLHEAFRALVGSPPTSALLRAFELQMLAAMGLAPVLDRCVNCNQLILGEPVSFDEIRGGIICEACGTGRMTLGPEVHQCLSTLQDASLIDATRLEVLPQVGRSMRDVMQRFLQCILNKNMRSMDFMYQLAAQTSLPQATVQTSLE
jgi:DNA repair protein RecO (recombination protein O)